jgi:hypothetical protein
MRKLPISSGFITAEAFVESKNSLRVYVGERTGDVFGWLLLLTFRLGLPLSPADCGADVCQSRRISKSILLLLLALFIRVIILIFISAAYWRFYFSFFSFYSREYILLRLFYLKKKQKTTTNLHILVRYIMC